MMKEQQALEEGVPNQEEQAAVDDTPDGAAPSKRRRRIIIAVIVVAIVLIAITLSAVLTTDDEETPVAFNPEYQNILTEMRINASSSDTELEQAIGALTDYFLSTCSAGISVAVTRNGTRIIVPRGLLNMSEPSRVVDQETLFEIGSVSKPVTGLVLAHEIVAGNLTLDTPLNQLLPESIPDLVVNGELVTFRQLVTHTAGFPRLAKVVREQDYQSFSEPNPYAGYSEEDMLREISIAATELSQTGEYQYSNFGFSVLAYLLGKSTNMSFPVLQRELLQSLGLENTWIELPDEARQNLSTGYQHQEKVPYWFDGGLFINGAGSTLSSTRDLLLLVELLMTPEEKLQDTDLIEALQQSLSSLHAVAANDNGGISFAWNYGGMPRLWAHGGATAGFVTHVVFQPATNTGVVALSNCGDHYDIGSLGNALASKLFLLEEPDERKLGAFPAA